MEQCRENKAAIVTGASSGIGAAISARLCEMGYEVFGIGRSFGSSFAEQFPDAAGNPLFHAVADLSESVSELNDSSKAMLAKVGEAGKTVATATVVGKTAQTASHLFKKHK